MARAFIIRPFGTKKDSGGAEIDFDRVDWELIRPALEAVNLGGGTTGEIVISSAPARLAAAMPTPNAIVLIFTGSAPMRRRAAWSWPMRWPTQSRSSSRTS